jgi:aerobic carbon-monoxide dehydrogenase medium subunit
MKPAAFEYYDPTTIRETLNLLAQFGDEARPLAGGQSLVPLMNFRLLKPAHVIDLNGVKELTFLQIENNSLRIGAMTRQQQLECSSDVALGWPLLRDATRYIGHSQIRNRGTVGGSLAHAFAAAELPMAMVTLGASFLVRANTGQRLIAADDFFLSHMTTALEPGELLTEIHVPSPGRNTGWSFQEVSRRYGDFALAGAAAVITLDSTGLISHARLTLTGATPIRSRIAEELLLEQQPSERLFREAAQRGTAGLEQDSDIHATANYRRSACDVLARRALIEASTRAMQMANGTSL